MKLDLPFWLNGARIQTIKRTVVRWWSQAQEWLRIPLDLGDATTAPLTIVDLYAFQRNISRYPQESEWLYRLRVQHALLNARDAGTIAGTKRIFERLRLPISPIEQRLPGYDWDMLRLTIPLDLYHEHRIGLNIVLREYRRTCRRWIVQIEAPPAQAHSCITLAGLMIIESQGMSLQITHTTQHTSGGLAVLEAG